MSLLPTTRTPKKESFEDLTFLIYGAPKIGKSTLAAQADQVLFLATEAGLNHLDVYQAPVDSWKKFLVACGEIAAGKHEFKTICIDTIDNLYKFCSEHVLAEHGVKHESDLGFGKGWALVNAEFMRALTKLSLLPYGLIMISHAQEREIDDRTGKYTKTMPTLPESARKVLMGMVDIIAFCMIERKTENGEISEDRVVKTKPAKNYEAGDRTDKLPASMPMNFVLIKSALKPKTETQKETK